MKESRNHIDVTIGTDVEFVGIDNGHIIDGKEHFNQDADFSFDGRSTILELRSTASADPIVVANSIRDVIYKAIENTPEILNWKLLSRSCYKELRQGTHFHYGIPKGIINGGDAVSQFLEHYVGAICILLEDKKQGIKRRTPFQRLNKMYNYGLFGDYRNKDHGFEQRSPSSFLQYPEIIKALLCLAKVVMNEVVNNRKNFRFKQYVMPEDFTEMNHEKLYELFPEIWRDITNMEAYSKYQHELAIIPRFIKRRHHVTNCEKTMNETWEFKNVKVQPRQTFRSIWDDWGDEQPKEKIIVAPNLIKPIKKKIVKKVIKKVLKPKEYTSKGYNFFDEIVNRDFYSKPKYATIGGLDDIF